LKASLQVHDIPSESNNTNENDTPSRAHEDINDDNIVQVPSCYDNINTKGRESTKVTANETPKRIKNQSFKEMEKKSYLSNEASYMKTIRETPSHICSCCGGLFNKNAISGIKGTKKGPSNELIEKICCIEQPRNQFCVTCKRYIGLNKIPRLCLIKGFQFPVIPESLKLIFCLKKLKYLMHVHYFELLDIVK